VKRICDALDHRTLIQTQSPLVRVRRLSKEVEIRYKQERIILPKQDTLLLPLMNTSTELLAEYVANQIRRQVRLKFPAAQVRSLEVGVEEARSQRGFYREEF